MEKACTRRLSARDSGARDSGRRDETDRIARIVVALPPEDDRRDRVQVAMVRRCEWRGTASAGRCEGHLETRTRSLVPEVDRRWIEARGCGAGPSKLRDLVWVNDQAMVVIVMTVPRAILVTVMPVTVVIVTVVIVVTVVMMVGVVVVGMAPTDGMMMPVATGVHMRASVAMGVRQERERSHAGPDAHGRQRNEDRDGPGRGHDLSLGEGGSSTLPGLP